MNRFHKILIVVTSIVLGGFLMNQIRSYSERTTWERIDYFPFPIENLLVVKPFGKEFWIETKENFTYRIIYPCLEGETCWGASDDVPTNPLNGDYIDEEIHEYLHYDKREGSCGEYNDSSFPGKIKTCITSTALAESFYVFSLVLTDKNELWVWDNPWESPYTVMENIATSVCVGGFIGFIVSLLGVILWPKIRDVYGKNGVKGIENNVLLGAICDTLHGV